VPRFVVPRFVVMVMAHGFLLHKGAGQLPATNFSNQWMV
jgi:hypothetical protein